MTAASGRAAPAPVPDTGVGPAPEPGRLDVLGPALARLCAPNPGVMTGPGTNTYLLGGTGDVAVVDPGPDDPAHLERVVRAVGALGGTLRWVLVTHTHSDHAPGASALRAETGAVLVGHSAKGGFVPDVAAREGFELETPAFRLRALHTPGHASDHLCYLAELPGGLDPGADASSWRVGGSARALLAGDHVMDRVTVVVAPPDGDMAAYLSSLERLLELRPEPDVIAPGHGRLLSEPATVVRGVIAHRLDREERVAAALGARARATVDELLTDVYGDVDPGLHRIARLSLWAHLRKLVTDGRAQVVTELVDGGGQGETRDVYRVRSV